MFLFHGFDHMGLYRHAVDWALDQGFVVIAIRLWRAISLSSGERASIDDFAVYQDVVQALFEQARALQLPAVALVPGKAPAARLWWIHLLGHGVDSPAQGKTFLLSPAVWPRLGVRRARVPRCSGRSSKALPGLPLDNATTRSSSRSWRPTHCSHGGCRLPGWAPWRAGSNVLKRRHAARGPLIVQGEKTTVDWQHNLKVLRSKFGQPEVLMLPRGRHHLANEIPEFGSKYFGFLTDHLK